MQLQDLYDPTPLLPRYHLWEWHDFDWVPQRARSFITTSLSFGWRFIPLPQLAPINRIVELVDEIEDIFSKPDALVSSSLPGSKVEEELILVDLCSGSGGPMPALIRRLRQQHGTTGKNNKQVSAILTDLYPHITEWNRIERSTTTATEDGSAAAFVKGYPHSVNAMSVMSSFSSLSLATKKEAAPKVVDYSMNVPSTRTTTRRTLFGSFHHFTPQQAVQILRSAVVGDAFDSSSDSPLGRRRSSPGRSTPPPPPFPPSVSTGTEKRPNNCKGILVVEMTERYIPSIILFVLMTLLMCFLFPFVTVYEQVLVPYFSESKKGQSERDEEKKKKPLLDLVVDSLKALIGIAPELFFIFIVPILPAIFVWDAIVSCLRGYTPKEMLEMARRADASNEFEWTAGRRKCISFLPNWIPQHVVYLVGTRREEN